MYTVYQHKNKLNKKVYIGITKQIPEQRWGINGKNINLVHIFIQLFKNTDEIILNTTFFLNI